MAASGCSTKVNPVDGTFRIRISRSDEMNDAERCEIEELEQTTFDYLEDEIDWAIPEWYAIGKLAERVISIVGVLKRRVEVGEITLEIGGIGGVVTHPDHRQHGFASALLRSAAEFMRDDLQVEYGLLLCNPDKVDFYGRLGWQIALAEMVCDLHGSKEIFDGITMVLPLGYKPWPEGSIDLCGTPW